MTEPVARLLHWHGPAHRPVPHGGIAARTFAEFPKGSGEGAKGYWSEGAPLFAHPAPASRLIFDAPAGYVTSLEDGASFMVDDENDIGIAVYTRPQVEAMLSKALSASGSPARKVTRPDEQDAPGSSIGLGAEGEQ